MFNKLTFALATRGRFFLRVAQIAAVALAVLGVVELGGSADDFDPPGSGGG